MPKTCQDCNKQVGLKTKRCADCFRRYCNANANCSQTAVCLDCKCVKPKYVKGLCEQCYKKLNARKHTQIANLAPICCQDCNKVKPEKACGLCGNCYRKSIDNEDRKLNRSTVARKRKLGTKFKITQQQYQSLLDAQGGHCACCPATHSGKGNGTGQKALAVDHDHKTGQVRGLLCSKCNLSIGNAGDNPDIVQNWADYLRSSTNTLIPLKLDTKD